MPTSLQKYSRELLDQYARMKRAYNQALTDLDSSTRSKSAQQTLDSVHEFLGICYHFKERIEEDPLVSQSAKDQLPTFLVDDKILSRQICRDLANKFKHSKLKRKPNDPNTDIVYSGPAVFSVSTKELDAAARNGKVIHAGDEDSIYLGDFHVIYLGSKYRLDGVVKECMTAWEIFLGDHDLLMPRTSDR